MTELLFQHPRTHLRASQRETEGKGKDRFKRGHNSNTPWFRGKGKGKHTGSGKSGASACYANFTSVEYYDYDDDMNEPADACQAHNDPVDPGSDDGEEALDDDDDEKNDTFSFHVALDDVIVFEAAELDAIALLADTWDNNLDPEVSKCTTGASERTSLPFLRKGERKR